MITYLNEIVPINQKDIATTLLQGRTVRCMDIVSSLKTDD